MNQEEVEKLARKSLTLREYILHEIAEIGGSNNMQMACNNICQLLIDRIFAYNEYCAIENTNDPDEALYDVCKLLDGLLAELAPKEERN